jgi:hypothetical protein
MNIIRKLNFLEPGMVVHTYNFSTGETEAGGLWDQGKSVLHSEFEAETLSTTTKIIKHFA